MIRIVLSCLTALLLVVSGAASARQSPMPVFPRQAILSQPGTPADVRLAIKQAAVLQAPETWTVIAEDAGSIRLQLNVRNKHYAVIDIVNIDATSCDIKYVSSVNLNYTKNEFGAEEIHPNFERWVQALMRNVRAQGLQLQSRANGVVPTTQPLTVTPLPAAAPAP
ncbi:MAG: hypothetical protein QM803_01755 [Rhodocyclaceae bacterium]